MPETDSMELLRDYRDGSESAFAELVQRHIGLVYSAALRHVENASHAEEITQAVFIILARKAGSLRSNTILEGWLYETTRLTSLSFLRGERRRQFREQEAHMRSILQEKSEDTVWTQLAPLLDEAMARLRKKDRDVVVLRFFNEKSVREVAAALQISEPAAQRRVLRALEKLRSFFTKRGVSSTTAIIAGAISAHSVQAAPIALGTSVTAAAIAKGATASVSTLTLIHGALKIMAWTKTKSAIAAGVVLLLAVGTTSVTVARINNERKTEKLWRINKTVPSAQIDRLPPMVKVLPTKFVDSPWVNWNSGSNGDKFVGANSRVGEIAAYAYGFPRGRVLFPAGEPRERYDYAATLAQGSREALQRELRRLGLVGRRQTDSMDVLLLRVKYANAPGLKPPIAGKNDAYMKNGAYHSSDVAISTGYPRFEGLAPNLERYFKMPIVDETGITQHFAIDLRWREEPEQRNPEGLKQALLERLGFELVPASMPIEMLVMEPVGQSTVVQARPPTQN